MATVAWTGFTSTFAHALPLPEPWLAQVALGAGLVMIDARGEGREEFEGHRMRLYTGAYLAELSFGREIDSWLTLRASALAGVTAPRPVLRFDEECALAAPRCDTVAGVCVACLGDGDCIGENVCALPANVCAERRARESCDGLSPVCDASGLCRACRSDGECPIEAPLCLATGACVQCLEHFDCFAEEFDEPLLCNPAGRCVECLDHGGCYDFCERSNTFLGQCAEPCSLTEPCLAAPTSAFATNGSASVWNAAMTTTARRGRSAAPRSERRMTRHVAVERRPFMLSVERRPLHVPPALELAGFDASQRRDVTSFSDLELGARSRVGLFTCPEGTAISFGRLLPGECPALET